MVVFGSHTVHRQTRNLKPVAIYVLHVIQHAIDELQSG